MRKLFVWMIFSALLWMPAMVQAETLEPSMSISLMSKNDEWVSSMRFGLNYEQRMALPRLGNSQLVLSVALYMDLENELQSFVAGDAPNFNGIGGKLSLAWSHPISARGSNVSLGAISAGVSLETLVDANGQRHFMLNLQPVALNFNMNVGGQKVTIMSSMNLGLGMNQHLNSNDLATLNRIKNAYRVK